MLEEGTSSSELSIWMIGGLVAVLGGLVEGTG